MRRCEIFGHRFREASIPFPSPKLTGGTQRAHLSGGATRCVRCGTLPSALSAAARAELQSAPRHS